MSVNISSLFSGMNSGTNSSIYGNLAELSSIRSGSYYKLAKKYYASSSSDSSSVQNVKTERVDRTEYDYKRGDYKVNLDKEDSATSSSISTSKDKTSVIADVEDSAQKLKTSADALVKTGKASVFTQTDGEYDTDKIYSAVSDFVKNYNSAVSAAGSSESTSVSNAVKSMTNKTFVNSRLLASVGITADSSNKLSVDEKTFKAADMDKVKELFNGNGSYGYQISASASMIDYAAQNEASKSNTYNSVGAYSNNYNVGYLFDQAL